MQQAKAQYKVSGKLQDTTLLSSVELAGVSLINAADSILVSYTRSDAQGNYLLEVPEKSKYLLMVSHPSFAIYVEEISIENTTTTLPDIILTTKLQMLETVFFTDEKAIMIKGDTTIYSADSFKVREFATVDELLKRLPGIEVSKTGKITAYGKDVQKMYVDGEEFFSDDPSVVAKTLQASSIDKVKVYDDRSEYAKNTGVDDGEQVKTINLTLKENAKNGYTGKLSGGYAPESFFTGYNNIQYFKNKQRIAAYLSGSNVGDLEFNFQDALDFGDIELSSGEDGISSMSVSDGLDGLNNSEGIPTAINGGASYMNKFFDNKLQTNLTYSIRNLSVEKINNGINRIIMPDTQFVNENRSNSLNRRFTHRIATVETIKFDSLTSLVVKGSLTIGGINNTSERESNARDIGGTLLNSSSINNTTISDNSAARVNALFNKRLKKQGRSFSIGAGYNTSKSNAEATLRSTNRLFAIDSLITFNQRKDNIVSSNSYLANATYTEPLIAQKLFLELNYSFERRENNNNNRTYDRDNGGEVFNSIFSNVYTFNYNNNTGGFNLSFKEKKLNANIGLAANQIQFEQINILMPELNRNYGNFNLFPKAGARYLINSNSSVSFRYVGSTTQPTMSQLQPLVVNTDPTNIVIGNDRLVQSFNNSFNLRYHTHSVIKKTYSFASLTYNQTSRPITQSQFIDASGIRTYQFVNTKSSNQVNGTLYYNKTLLNDLGIGLNISSTYATDYTINNGQTSQNNTFMIMPGLNADWHKDTTVSIRLNFRPNYFSSSSSLRTDVKNRFWTYTTNVTYTQLLPWNFEFTTSLDWNYRPQLDKNIQGNNVLIWNASISRNFLKNRSLNVGIMCHDILNQNIGFNYFQTGFNTTETSWNVVRQYFMLTAKWSFKNGTGSQSDAVKLSN